ncbi:MAG TPA: hypothetical protein VMT62_17480 [Syntrophorhabdaceae bacterium]|nr:hypothetical protein [Syntrophorhabdaceae bacterium]
MEDKYPAIQSTDDAQSEARAFSALSLDQKRAFLKTLDKTHSEPAGIFLNAVYPVETDKEILKLIRRLLFKLKAAGVKVEEPKAVGDTVLRRIEEVREHRGFLTNYDYTETRLVVAGFELKRNTYLFLNAEIHFAKGLTELMSAPVDKKGFEGILNEYRKDTRRPMLFEEISPAYAAWLIEEGSNRSHKFRDEIKPLKSFIAGVTAGVGRPEDVYALSVSEMTNAAKLDAILAHDIFDPLSITWDSLGEDRKQYSSDGASSIILPSHMAAQRKTEYLERLSQRSDINAMIPLLKRMMEDYAYLFYCMKEFSYYRGLMAYLAGEAGAHDVLIHFLKKSLEKKEEKPEGQDTGQGLIINPYG